MYDFRILLSRPHPFAPPGTAAARALAPSSLATLRGPKARAAIPVVSASERRGAAGGIASSDPPVAREADYGSPAPDYVTGPAPTDSGGRRRTPLRVTIRPLPRNRIDTTARRWKEAAFEAPVSMTVHSRKDVDDTGTENSDEIIARTPSLAYTSLGGDQRANTITSRGLATFVPVGGVDQPVAFYIDDVFIGRDTGFNLDLIDIERVEILRGPQVSNYGKNALAGALKFHTRQPEAKRTASLETNVGNFDLYSVRAHYNDVIVPEKIYGRIAGGWAQRDGYVYNRLEDRDIDDLDRWGLRGQLRGTPSPDFGWNLSADYTQDRSSRRAGGPFDTIATHETAVVDTWEQAFDNYGVALRGTYRAGDHSLESITAFRGLTYDADGDGPTPNQFFHLFHDESQYQVTQEIRLTSDTRGDVRWSAGVFFLGEEQSNIAIQELRALAPALGVAFGHRETSDADTRTLSGAVYGQATKELGARIEVTAGARLSVEYKAMDYSHTGDGGVTVLATGQTASPDRTFVDLSPEFTIAHDWRGLVKTYGKIGRGFKSGGFTNGFVAGSEFEFDPETAWNFEVGVKSILMDGRLDLNAAAYYMDISDLQVESFTITGGSRTSNAEGAASAGFEVESALRPVDGFEMTANASYVDATFDDYPDAPNPERSTSDATGNRLPLAPRYSLLGAAQYARHFDIWLALVGRFEFVYNGPTFFDPLNRLREPSHGLVNARLGLEGRNWSLFLWGKNLLDTEYRIFGGDLGAPIGRFGFAGPPRTYGVRFRLTH